MPVTPALVSLLNSAGGANPLIQRDFYTLTLQDGTQLRYAESDFHITVASPDIWNPPDIRTGAGLWQSGLVWEPDFMQRGDGQTASWKLGLGSNTWLARYSPRSVDAVTGQEYPDQINGVPWIKAARSGALEQADVIVSTAYFASAPTMVPMSGTSPVGTLTTFRGMIGEVDCSDGAVFMTIIDYRYLLTQMMPRNQYQSSCRHRLYDERCTLSETTYSRTGVVASASGSSLTSAGAVAAPGGSNTYALGTLRMTSGLNSGFRRLVTSWDGASAFTLLNPFPFAVQPGDTFTVSAGCAKTLTVCNSFGNKANFGGNPYIPVPEVALS